MIKTKSFIDVFKRRSRRPTSAVVSTVAREDEATSAVRLNRRNSVDGSTTTASGDDENDGGNYERLNLSTDSSKVNDPQQVRRWKCTDATYLAISGAAVMHLSDEEHDFAIIERVPFAAVKSFRVEGSDRSKIIFCTSKDELIVSSPHCVQILSYCYQLGKRLKALKEEEESKEEDDNEKSKSTDSSDSSSSSSSGGGSSNSSRGGEARVKLPYRALSTSASRPSIIAKEVHLAAASAIAVVEKAEEEAPAKTKKKSKKKKSKKAISASVEEYSGYVTTNVTAGHHLFFWARACDAGAASCPTALWQNGGPGASSIFYGLLNENGWYHFNATGNIYDNPYSWTKVANMIYLDQPVRTGWSYSTTGDWSHFDNGSNWQEKEVVKFLRHFFTLYPHWLAMRQFYISGESYGGRWTPEAARIIVETNERGIKPEIPLCGITLGDAWVHPIAQVRGTLDFSLENGLISRSVFDFGVDNLYPRCLAAYNRADYTRAGPLCYGVMGLVLFNNPHMEIYDIRKRCPITAVHDCYNFSAALQWLTSPSTRKRLGAGTRPFHDPENYLAVESFFDGIGIQSTRYCLQTLLAKGIRVLAYNGVFDFACNWRGTQSYLKSMTWKQHAEYDVAPFQSWKLKNGTVAGEAKSTSNRLLTFVKVFGAGHLAPYNQPQSTLDLFTRFIRNESFVVD